MILSRSESDLANRLIKVYFDLFKVLVAQNKLETKMMSALLSGVNRAHPYTQLADELCVS